MKHRSMFTRNARGVVRGIACLVVVAGLMVAAFAEVVGAEVVTSYLWVSASVPAACSVSGSSISFGEYSGAPSDATGTIQVKCREGTSYTIKLNVGSGGGTFAERKLVRDFSSSGDKLGFNLYKDPARTQIWGDGSEGTYTVSDTGTNGWQTFIVYGRIPGEQSVPPGSYSSNIQVTVEF